MMWKMYSESCGSRTEPTRCQQLHDAVNGGTSWKGSYRIPHKKWGTKTNLRVYTDREMHMYHMDSHTTYSKYE